MDKNAAKGMIKQGIASGPFDQKWESLQAYRIPAWYEDAKFGIFIHWGVYSVPAFGNEWYPRNMYIQGSPEFNHHLETYGPQSQFGYKDFIPLFTAEKFDADHWANLFRRAGAQFVVPVAEHHDGFALYDCGFSEWTATRMGPKRDIIGELAEAVRKQWLVFGLSSHRAEHWWFYDGGMKFDADVQDTRYAGLYGPAQPKTLQPNEEFLDDWLLRTCELVDKYQPQLVWFDWWIEEPAFRAYLQNSPLTTIIAEQSGSAELLSITSTMLFLKERLSMISSVGNCLTCVRSSGKPIRLSQKIRGVIRKIKAIKR